jgi:chromosome segregation ATPase
MATLALLFTINIVLKTPFIMLDESDAFLDADNTDRYLDML